MRDEDKSKEQLIAELKELRRQAGKGARGKHPLFAPAERDGTGKKERNKVRVHELEREVAECQRAEEALREAHQKLEAIVHASPLSIFVLDPEGKVVLWNEASEETFGWTESEALGRVLPIVPEEKLEEFRNNLQRGLAGESIRGMELRRRKKDGSPIDISIYTSPLYDRQGKVTGVMALNADITGRKQAEEALRESELKYRTLFESSAQGFFLMTDIFLDCNEQACRLWKCNREDIIGHSPEEFSPEIQPDGRRSAEAAQEYLQKALGGAPQFFYWQHLRKDGVLIDTEISLKSITVGGQQLLQATMRDITARKQAAEALRESEEKYRSLIETANDAILTAEVDTGIIVDANPKAQELLGLPREKIIGMHQSQIHPPAEVEKYRDIFRNHCRAGGLITGDIFVVDAAGRHVPVEISASTIELRGKKLIHGIFRDLSERQRSEEALRRSEEKFRLLVSQIPAVVFEGYRDWSVDFLDNKIEELTGYSKEDFDSRRIKWSDVVLPEDLDYATRIFIEALKGDGAFVREHRIRRKDRGIRWIQCRGQIIFDAGGKIDHISGVTFDITHRKEVEDALRESEGRYRLLFESNPQPLWVYDLETLAFLEVNQAAVDLYDYSREEFLAMTVKDIRPLEDVEPLLRRVEKLKLRPGIGYSGEWRHIKKSGEVINVEIISHEITFMGRRARLVLAKDITARKAAEKALRESEEKYRLLVNQIPAVVFKGYSDWSIDFFDNKVEVLTGYPKEEFDSRRIKWHELILPEDLEKSRGKLIEGVRNGGAYGREYRIRKKDGGIAWVQVMGQTFYDAAGKVDYVSGVFFDVTGRKQVEEELRNREAKLSSILRTVPTGIGVVVDRVLVEVNDRISEMTGYTAQELVGQSAGMLYATQEDFDFVGREKYRQIMETGSGTVETRWRRKDGSIINVLLSSTPIVPGDLASGVTFSAMDITERRRNEEALRQSEEKYRLLVNQIPAVVYKGYLDWGLECFDRKIEEITGYAKEDFDSRRITWLDLIFPEDIEAAKTRFKEALHGDGSYVTEHRIRKRTGEVLWIQARNRLIYNAAGRVDHISGVFFDITARKELEDQLNKAQRMEAIGILAGGLAHDFNNLLTAIMGYSEIMMMGLKKEDPFHLYVEEITKAANRGASLTNQLLAFSRKQILQPRVINLNVVVLEMDRMLRRLIGEDIDLATLTDQELGFVKADPGQIEQIIMNLAVNARDAMPDGGKLTVETANVYLDDAYARSHVDVAPGCYVLLAVSDNGLGMDAGITARIFEPFFTTKESGKGTGLGLATVYGIVKQSGGHIWVYSEPGLGTTFKIYLPRVEELPVAFKPKVAAPASLEGHETVLVVEDDAALRELISTALRKYGFKVLEAAHGGEALLICEKYETTIHLILTDVVMPQISGTVLAERLKGLHPEMRVLYMSGYTEDAIVHHGVLNSKVNFISKPFRVLALVQKVREVLDSPEEGKLLH